MRFVLITSLLFAANTLFLTGAASACEPAMDGPTFRDGQTIFVGRLVDYEVLSRADSAHETKAVLTYAVDEVLRGSIDEQVEVVWNGSLYGWAPQTIEVPVREIVRVIPAVEDNDLPELVVGGCGYLDELPASNGNIALAKHQIASGQGTKLEFEQPNSPMTAITDRGLKRRIVLFALLGVSMIALVIGLVIYKRRRKTT